MRLSEEFFQEHFGHLPQEEQDEIKKGAEDFVEFMRKETECLKELPYIEFTIPERFRNNDSN